MNSMIFMIVRCSILLFLMTTITGSSCQESENHIDDTDSTSGTTSPNDHDLETDSHRDTQTSAPETEATETDSHNGTESHVPETEASTADDTDTDVKQAVEECMDRYGGCECMNPCADGYTAVVHYPTEAEDYPEGASHPPKDLLDIGLALYECSKCGACDQTIRIKKNDVWQDVDIKEYCEYLVSGTSANCKPCLKLWSGYTG